MQQHVGAGPAISAVTVENLFYIASVIIVFMCFTAALLLPFPVSVALRRTVDVTLWRGSRLALVVVVLLRRVRIAGALVTALNRGHRRRAAGDRRADVAAIV